jgi:hypothetical protein
MTKSTYQPPYTITPEILNRVAGISEVIGRLTVLTDQARALRLRPSVAPAPPCARDIQDIRVHNRIRTSPNPFHHRRQDRPVPSSALPGANLLKRAPNISNKGSMNTL